MTTETVLLPVQRFRDEKGPSCYERGSGVPPNRCIITDSIWSDEMYSCRYVKVLNFREVHRPGPDCPIWQLTGEESTL